MPTPPCSSSNSTRNKLPSSSPSSARLRRIAPSPVKIPTLNQTSPIGTRLLNPVTHSALNDLSNTYSLSFASDGKEYEFAPLELIILSSPDTQIRTLFEVLESSRTVGGRRRRSVEGDGKLPLIFDSRGEFGRLALEARARDRVDVPCSPCGSDWGFDEESEGSPSKRRRLTTQRGDDLEQVMGLMREVESLTPSLNLNLKQDVPSPILITFKEDIFTEKGRNKIWLDAQTEEEESTPRYSTERNNGQTVSVNPGRLDREDSSESFNTFGHGLDLQLQLQLQPQAQVQSQELASLRDGLDDELDNWSFTLSAYEDDTYPEAGGMRKDSFFAFGSSSTVDLTLISTPSTLDISFDTTLTSTKTKSSSYIPHVNLSQDQNYDNSPLSDTIITPHPPHTYMSKSWPPELLDVEDELEDTPTPKNGSYGFRSRVVSSDKKLPALPFQTGSDNHSDHSITPAEENRIPSKKEENEGEAVEVALKGFDRNMTIQLWVDQEGCRENRSSLRFIRSIKPSVFREREEKALKEAAAWCESPTRPECFQQSGCWEFGMDPKERDRWLFHHAALEGLPVLRRLTINGDDKYDYLSRGATLQIKEPGVYSVCGVEERGKAEWKFEYLVQNKLSASTKEQSTNERILVPLGLYVSPNFFNPDRALKTSLLNLFKKTLASNIMSEKVRPPHIGKPPVPPAPNTPTEECDKSATAKTEIPMASTVAANRKRSQTQSQIQIQSHQSSTPSHGHSRSVSRTIGAIAKAVAGMTNTSTTPTSQVNHDTFKSPTPNGINSGRPGSSGIHKFGTKPATFGRSTLGSRSKTPTSSTTIFDHADGPVEASGNGNNDEKKKNRKRSTSLFSRSRPFTPPVNITELHPIPVLSNAQQMKSSTPPATVAGGGLLVPLVNNHTSISLPLQQPTNIVQKGIRQNRLSHPHPHAHPQGHPFLHPSSSGAYSPTLNMTVQSQTLLTRSSSITSRSKPIAKNQQDTLGSLPINSTARRGIRKRPSTAEPRLGMR
ncbi:hypothetical protein I302_109165 [Kwoniella bestiolae CBS 10118]|uniref:Uncharacterized protein n=1 Tax=Kwoniella bestiolae CBS 10118 TaxID=1296100 RepID=A0A1B9FV61_9TREE|nr:hypothetical protein I302_08311 [Kwoniella bestiolae CBS 10118]OCF22660.1 hypothetical protein I302_08311 [Kwoniella bestiolae CBS 10118]